MIDWSVVIGIATGLGLPGIAFTVGAFRYVVRQESRVAVLENAREKDDDWKQSLDERVASIARDVNQLIGSRRRD